jgi:hypothetical protein
MPTNSAQEDPRRRVVLELDARQTSSRLEASQSERLSALSWAAKVARDRFFADLAPWRNLDPGLTIEFQSDTIFPLLEVSTTDSLINLIAQFPSVKRVSASPQFKMADVPAPGQSRGMVRR